MHSRSTQRVEQPLPATTEPQTDEPLRLNADQQIVHAALSEALSTAGFQPFLLHGVTGSGKTEIYLQAIEKCVRAGQGSARAGAGDQPDAADDRAGSAAGSQHVAVLHSHLGDAERGGHWRQIAAGQVQVVVGARSAVFAPTRRLGLIVIDEEHESSFKQETTPRYHARDVAVHAGPARRTSPSCSARPRRRWKAGTTPSAASTRLLSLPNRVLDRPLPPVH